MLRGRRCLRCPFCAPSGRCLDPRTRSGRCGDWVFYLVRGKQLRRLWIKPRDPRTPSQRYWRARLAAASRKYSHTLTKEQVDACIAAGARRRSRPRLAQSGRLTGQQWWVRTECAGQTQAIMPGAQTAVKPLQTQSDSLPTWEPHRDTSASPPCQYRGDKRQAGAESGKAEIRRPPPERRPRTEGPKAPSCPGARVSVAPLLAPRIALGFRAWDFGFGRSALGRPVRMRPGGLRPRGRAACSRASRVEADWRRRRGEVERERGPP